MNCRDLVPFFLSIKTVVREFRGKKESPEIISYRKIIQCPEDVSEQQIEWGRTYYEFEPKLREL